jgi:hypothetical protein
MDAQELISKLVAYDNGRARSMQTAVGVSSLGDCRRKVWHLSRGDKGSNPTLRLSAIMGNAIHSHIEKVLATDGALLEHRVEIEGLPPATMDYYKDGQVVDWKTIKLAGVPYFVTQQKRWQVQVYGYLMSLSGFDVHTVTLVGIPRDGTEQDIVVHSEPYDESVALDALAWLRDVQSQTEPPAPERDAATFCSKYCPLFGEFCQGLPKDISGVAIVDDVATDAAKDYVRLSVEIKNLEARKDAAKAALEGVAGVTIDGIRVSWSEVAGRQTPDVDAIKSALGQIPMRQGAPSVRLTVK